MPGLTSLASMQSAQPQVISGSSVFAVISVDRFGSVVHLIEATLALFVLACVIANGSARLRRHKTITAVGLLTGLTVAAVPAADLVL